MEETKPELPTEVPLETLDELQQAFSNHCAHAGSLAFEIKIKEAQIFDVHQKMSEINQKVKRLKTLATVSATPQAVSHG